jgi:hypothetical protein
LTLAEHLPLVVAEVQWVDPTLTVVGDDWSLSVTCPWRVVTPHGIAFSCSTADAEDQLWDTIGKAIVSIEPQGATNPFDPVFRFADDTLLELFSDSELDPWSLQLPGMSLVGPLRMTEWSA